jgi:hypothetical protein
VANGAVIIHAFLSLAMYRRDRFGPSPLIPVNKPQIHMDKVCVSPIAVQEKVYKEILLSLGGI